MASARAILSPEQQNMERRLNDCDGCHNPKNRPVYRMMVDIGSAYGGGISQSVFLICQSCSRKPIQLFLHGSGHCAPGIRTVDDAHTLGKADIESRGPRVVEEVVEPPVEVIHTRMPDNEDEILEAMGVEPKPKRGRRARAGKRKAASDVPGVQYDGFMRTPRPVDGGPPPALDPCVACGHQRGFHINGPCEYDKFVRGCRCRGFEEK